MGLGAGHWLRRGFHLLQPPPRLVDWAIFTIVCFEAITGVITFTVGISSGWPIFWIHRIAGLTLVILIGFKLFRVRDQLLRPANWQPSTLLSTLTVTAVAGTILTGILWVLGVDSQLAHWSLLSVHVGFGLALLPLMFLHLKTRFRVPRRVDFNQRRVLLQFPVLLVLGTVMYRLQKFGNHLLDGPGGARRFTGSQPRTGKGNDSFPVTMWVADDPDPIDRAAWSLSITGAIDESIELSFADLNPDTTQRAVLDCTSGWYTVQDWRGMRVGDLLATVGISSSAKFVRFVSVTGYRWSLPLQEAQDALLATHVGDEPLSHGHGAPARLVAPGRRGFQWVKWVNRVEVRTRDDPAQWFVTLVSGFD